MKSKIKSKLAVYSALAGSCIGSANAALVEADIDAIVSGLTTDAELLFGKFLPVLGLILGFTVAMKLVKRFTAKAV